MRPACRRFRSRLPYAPSDRLAPWGRYPIAASRQLWVFRITWKLTQPRPTVSNRGLKSRRQQLSRDKGVLKFSEGNTQASSPAVKDIARHWSIATISPSDNAAHRTE